ncbi:MAG TPA: type II secretion system F family protein, partial [Methanosarcina vacuolata]|nr:type II secretion system F family protein [Methanosarcina vacuolata]
RLSETLERIGHAYELKIENSIKNISALLEPILLIVIGLAVGTIALSVFSFRLFFTSIHEGSGRGYFSNIKIAGFSLHGIKL